MKEAVTTFAYNYDIIDTKPNTICNTDACPMNCLSFKHILFSSHEQALANSSYISTYISTCISTYISTCISLIRLNKNIITLFVFYFLIIITSTLAYSEACLKSLISILMQLEQALLQVAPCHLWTNVIETFNLMSYLYKILMYKII